MHETILTPDVYIKDTGTAKGRGVFANRNFTAGEVVEICLVMVICRPYRELPPELQHLVYDWCALTNGEVSSGLALGFGSLYNHDNPANMCYQAIVEGNLMRYTAVRDIAKDEELTINYNNTGGDPDSDEDCWFERLGIEPI